MFNKHITILTSSILSVLALTACGGGGSSTTSVAPKPIVNNTINASTKVVGDTTGVVNQTVSLAIVAKNGTKYDKIVWQQVSGQKVTASANNQAVFNFTPKSAGDYEFKVVLSLNGKMVETLTHKITVSNSNSQVASLRGDKVVGSGGTTSVRFYTPTAIKATDWTLTQVSGTKAQIVLDKEDLLANIQVPTVKNDEVLVFKATAKHNPDLTDTVTILVKAQSVYPETYFCSSPEAGDYCLPLNALTNNYAYLKNGKYANVLAECTMSYELNKSEFCTLNTLPYLGSESQNPTIDDIMSRVVVSHDWMAENFEKFLRQYDTHNDFKRLFRSVTAIIISDSVRPSFYWAGTGAVYLDPDYLWLTAEQRDDVSEVADYRSDFGNDLKFESVHDYEKNGKSIIYGRTAESYNPDINLRKNRSLETMALPLASLLYHELAHANDYMPNESVKALSKNDFNKTAYSVQPSTLISDKLTTQYPLSSQYLKGLAQVVFGGAKTSSLQKDFTPTQVGEWFFDDKAVDLYSFYNSREDLAMLFEETMMFSRFGVNRYMMFIDPITFNIAKGYKNWTSSDNVKPRANFVVETVLPEASATVKQVLNASTTTKLCENILLTNRYNTNCVSPSLPQVNGYFYQQPLAKLPKAPTRGATPIGVDNLIK